MIRIASIAYLLAGNDVTVTAATEKAVRLVVNNGQPNSGATAWFPRAALKLEAAYRDDDGQQVYEAELRYWFADKLSDDQRRVIGLT